MTPRRILSISAPVGAGYERAAQAPVEAARSMRPEVQAEWLDALRFMAGAFRRLYAGSYLRGADRAGYRRLVEAVGARRTDASVRTHVRPANVAVASEPGRAHPVYRVVIDVDTCAQWVVPRVARCFVASGQGDPDRVWRDATANPERSRGAEAGGTGCDGAGDGGAKQKASRAAEGDAVRTGAADRARDEHARPDAGLRFDPHRGGRLALSRALARGLPMALSNPMPGRGERDAEHLLGRAAVRAGFPEVLELKVRALPGDRRRLAGPRAAREIVKGVLEA